MESKGAIVGIVGPPERVEGDDPVSGGVDDAEAGSSAASEGADAGTAPQSAPDPSYAAVPGPGIGAILLIVAGLALVIARRRLG